MVRRTLIAAMCALAVVALLAGPTDASSRPQNTLGPRWLVMSGNREFCGPIPQVSTMATVQPAAMSPPCKPNKYHKSLVKVVIMPLIVVALVAFGGCALCVKAGVGGARERQPQLSSAMGVRSSLLRGQADAAELAGISLNRLYMNKTRSPPVVAIIAALGTVVALAVAMVGSDEVHGLTYAARQIFLDSVDTQSSILAAATAALQAAHSGIADSIFQDAAAMMGSYVSGGRNVGDSLASLDHLRVSFLILTAVLVLATVVIGLAVHALKLRRLMFTLVVLAIIGLVCLWLNFLIYLTAANVISDMCKTINGCHFSCESAAGCGPSCSVPFFSALSACPDAAANRFATLTTEASKWADTFHAPVCTALSSLCTAAADGCQQPPDACSAASLSAHGLTTLACVGNAACYPVAALAANTTGNPAAYSLVVPATAVTDALATFESNSGIVASLESLSCAANNAFIEGTPRGTYNLLQELLCPRVVHPVNPPQKTFSITAAGLLAAGFIYPFHLLWLVHVWSSPARSSTTLLGLSQ